jgi:antiphage defense system Thoeris ThsB-like protein
MERYQPASRRARARARAQVDVSELFSGALLSYLDGLVRLRRGLTIVALTLRPHQRIGLWEALRPSRNAPTDADSRPPRGVLIGSETYGRPWVRYEILKSFLRGNSILGIHINNIKGQNQHMKPLGANPLASVGVTFSEDGQTGTLWEHRGGQWVKYSEIGGSADYSTDVASQHRGQCGR